MTATHFYKVLLVLLHILYSGLEFLYDICIYVKINFIENNRNSKLEDAYIAKIQQFEKIPKHLTVILGTEKPSLQDLANLVLWSLNAGIPFISFYDHEGFIQRHEDDLKVELDHRKGENDVIVWGNKGLNGLTNAKCIHIKTYTLADGRQALIETTKEISEKNKSEDVTPELIDREVRRHYAFPDPNLALYCGKQLNLFGYPPWFIKFTEFVNVRTFHNITQQCFLNILGFYSRVDQKLGK